MTQSLEDRIKDLERQLALKQAYLTVNFSFPKSNKLPDDVKEQVIAELKKACTQLADDKEETVAELNPNSVNHLTSEEVTLLKEFASVVKARTTSTPAPIAPSAVQPPAPEKKKMDSGTEGIKKAVLLTLEGVPASARNRVESGETVYVKSSDGETASIATKNGLIFKVPVDDLDFNV